MGRRGEEEERNQDIIETSDNERDADREVPQEYTIHGARFGGQGEEASLASAGSDGQEHLPFRLDKTKEVQSLPVLNHLVRSARFLTKLVPRQMFRTLGLDDRSPDHHLKVIHDLVCKVSLHNSLFCIPKVLTICVYRRSSSLISGPDWPGGMKRLLNGSRRSRPIWMGLSWDATRPSPKPTMRGLVLMASKLS